MDYHQNARTMVRSREQMARMVMEGGCDVEGCCSRGSRSAPRLRPNGCAAIVTSGRAGLCDLSSRPHCSPRQTPSTLLEKVLALRRLRYNGWRIARELNLSRATVSRILRRAGLNRLRSLDPPPPAVRYEHERPGDMIHFDIKCLARIRQPGHRVTGSAARSGARRGLGVSACGHRRPLAASAWPPSCPIRPTAQPRGSSKWRSSTSPASASPSSACSPITDPATAASLLALALRKHNIKHRFTRPYTPRTNGKAERFIQTALREWAYARTYQNSAQRQNQTPSLAA